MEFRSIASLEELETLPDDAQILVIDNNTAKRISKTNAHFGGGAGAMVVTFTLTQTGISADKTVEEVTTAMASMPVIGNIIMSVPNVETPITMHLGACFSEIAASGNKDLTPAFGPFRYYSNKNLILGFVGVNSSGQWEARTGR